MTIALYAGTFDPVTKGHMDIIDRSLKMFSKVVVGVASSQSKLPIFTLEKRIALIRENYSGNTNLELIGYERELTVDLMKRFDADVLIRGLRSTTDFEYELQLTNMNRSMWPEYECVFLTPKGDLSHISSSLIKEIATLGGDISKFVPTNVSQALSEALTK